jgi:small conductance mechanosensitive channel
MSPTPSDRPDRPLAGPQRPPGSAERAGGSAPGGEGRTPPRMFDTRSQSWREVGLLRQITPERVRRARREAILLVGLLVGVLVVYGLRHAIFGFHATHPCPTGGHPGERCTTTAESALRAGGVLLVLLLGGALARDAGRALRPGLYRRLEPGTAGTVGFIVRLVTVIAVVLLALWVAGVEPRTIGVVGGTLTALFSIVFGLAAQQTLGNFFAGTVLITARPFRVGERVRLQGGVLGGQLEGVVSAQGLLYTTFATGEDSILVPNSVVLGVAVRPLREPEAVTLRARLAPGMTPADLQQSLEESLRTPLRGSPRITLEELDDSQAVVQIAATPQRAADGRHLAGELLALVPARQRSEGGAAGAQPTSDGGVLDAQRPAQDPARAERAQRTR